MASKILRTLVVILLVLLPFLGGALLGKHSPYVEGNNMVDFVLLYAGIIVVISCLLFYVTHRFRHSFVQPAGPGIILFFMGCIMLGISGLAAPPDLSIKMLQHPEREHLRYIILFGGVIFFGWFFIQLLTSNSLQLKRSSKWILLLFFITAIIELVWEFNHHYHYPEALKEWLSKGNKAEDFIKNYDDWKSGTMGCIGRFAIYSLIAWLSIALYKQHRTGLWNMLLSTILCAFGFASVVVFFLLFNYNIHPPKALELLFLFFIPGVPFLLTYWIGVALLTKKPGK